MEKEESCFNKLGCQGLGAVYAKCCVYVVSARYELGQHVIRFSIKIHQLHSGPPWSGKTLFNRLLDHRRLVVSMCSIDSRAGKRLGLPRFRSLFWYELPIDGK